MIRAKLIQAAAITSALYVLMEMYSAPLPPISFMPFGQIAQSEPSLRTDPTPAALR